MYTHIFKFYSIIADISANKKLNDYSFYDIYGLVSHSLTELSIEFDIKLKVLGVFDTASPVMVSLCP